MQRAFQNGCRYRGASDGLAIKGKDLEGAEVNGHGDHRVVMALAIAGLKARGETVIDTAEAADVTFPGFFEKLSSCGASVTVTVT